MSRPVARLVIGSLVLLFALACNDRGLIPLDDVLVAAPSEVLEIDLDNQVDVLWVIDSSDSMCEEQSALAEASRDFLEELQEFSPDLHMAVVTTDMVDDRGVFRTGPGELGMCGQLDVACSEREDPVLRSTQFASETPGEWDLDAFQDAFTCLASVGTTGSGFERGLDAMAEALSPDLLDTLNDGFRRDGAWLVVIFVSDENDCSHGDTLDLTRGVDCEWQRDMLTDVETFVDQLAFDVPGTDEGERVIVASIVGPDDGVRVMSPETPSATCTSDNGQAFSGYRYLELTEAFGERGVTANICDGSFVPAVNGIARVIRSQIFDSVCVSQQLPTCESDADCPSTVSCGERGGVGICEHFELQLELNEGDSGAWVELSGPDSGEPDYDVNWGDTACPEGVLISFTPGTLPPESLLGIRYPHDLSSDVRNPLRGSLEIAE